MDCLLEVHSERNIFQDLMKSALSLIRIMSLTQGSTNQMLIVPQKLKLPTVGNIHLNQNQSMHGICNKGTRKQI